MSPFVFLTLPINFINYCQKYSWLQLEDNMWQPAFLTKVIPDKSDKFSWQGSECEQLFSGNVMAGSMCFLLYKGGP